MQRIDLNSDLGEAADLEQERLETLVFPFITSVNIACGRHAGDPELMRRTVRRAKAQGISVGAHPGFPDREYKGRRDLGLSPPQVEALVVSQIEALVAIAAEEGVRLTHVKPHGAMYGRAAHDPQFAEVIVRAVQAVDPRLTVVGFAGSPLVQIARDRGLPAAEEGFVDRAYEVGGYLAPRDMAGAVIADPVAVANRIERLVSQHSVSCLTGEELPCRPDTICVHGDTPGADRLVALIRATLERLGVAVVSCHGLSRA